MDLTLLKKLACFGALGCAVIAPAVAFADDEDSSEKKSEEAADVVAPAPDKSFWSLVRCTAIVRGQIEVMKAGESEWQAVEEGHYYPLGSSFRALATAERETPQATFKFGEGAAVSFDGAATFATRKDGDGAAKRTIELKDGVVLVSLPRALKAGMFAVVAPQFVCSDLAGDSRFEYTAASGDGDEAVVRVVTGSLAVKGLHYGIARMAAANQVRIRSAADGLFTSLRGESGDFTVTLDQGTVAQKDFETGDSKDVAKTLDFALSPKCAVKIFRGKASAADKMVVSVMTFDANGIIKNRCAYAEGRSNVNSGELVAAPAPKAEAKDENEEEKAEASEEKKEDAEEKSDDDKEEKKDDSSEE